MRKIFFAFCFIVNTSCCFSQSWNAIDKGIGDGSVWTITFNKEQIYAGGYFVKTGSGDTVYSIARWNSAKWEGCGLGLRYLGVPDSAGGAGAFAELDGKLFVAGGFSAAGGYAANDEEHRVNGIARWDSINWGPLCLNYDGANSNVTGLGVYNNKLYVGGHFGNTFGCHIAYSTHGISRWNEEDSTFTPIGYMDASWTTSYFAIQDFCVHDGILICGGDFDGAFDTLGNPYYSPHVIGWNDTTWIPIGGGLDSGRVFAVASYNGNLYAGGNFKTTVSGNPVHYLVRWDGIQWQTVGAGLNGIVYDFDVDTLNNLLYAAGEFTMSGSTVVNHIAVWDDNSWKSLGTGTDSTAYCVFAHNNDVYAGGLFITAGGVTVNRIARWGNPVGIEETQKQKTVINVSPNPTSGIFHLTTNSIQLKIISIFDYLGKTILEKRGVKATEITFDLSSQPKGVYTVRVLQGNQVSTQKVVVM